MSDHNSRLSGLSLLRWWLGVTLIFASMIIELVDNAIGIAKAGNADTSNSSKFLKAYAILFGLSILATIIQG